MLMIIIDIYINIMYGIARKNTANDSAVFCDVVSVENAIPTSFPNLG